MEQIKQIAFTCLRVFFGTLLASLVASGLGFIEWNTWGEWKPVIAGAALAAAVVVINAINPKDERYGLGATSE